MITDQIGPQVLRKPSVAKHMSETLCADSYRKETASPQNDSNNRGFSAQGKRRLELDTAISVPYVKVAKVTNSLGHNSAEVHGASKQMYNTNRGDMGKETVEKSFPTDHKSSVVKLEKTVNDISSELNGQSKDKHNSNMNEPAGSGIEDDTTGDGMLGCNATEKRLTESGEMKGKCCKVSGMEKNIFISWKFSCFLYLLNFIPHCRYHLHPTILHDVNAIQTEGPYQYHSKSNSNCIYQIKVLVTAY